MRETAACGTGFRRVFTCGNGAPTGLKLVRDKRPLMARSSSRAARMTYYKRTFSRGRRRCSRFEGRDVSGRHRPREQSSALLRGRLWMDKSARPGKGSQAERRPCRAQGDIECVRAVQGASEGDAALNGRDQLDGVIPRLLCSDGI